MKKAIYPCFLVLILFAGCLSVTDTSKKPDEPVAPAKGKNLVEDPGFEKGAGTWGPFGSCIVSAVSDKAHTGAGALFVSERKDNWNGAGVNLTPIIKKGATYAVSAWVCLENADSADLKLSIKKSDESGTSYTQADVKPAAQGEWIKLSGEYQVEATGQITELSFYIEGPGAGVNFYIDDVEVRALTPKTVGSDAADNQGLPSIGLQELAAKYDMLIGTAVTPSQTRIDPLKKVLINNYSSITAENEMKFYYIRGSEKRYNFNPADKLIEFAEENNKKVRGHTLVWHNNMPKWVEDREWTKKDLLAMLKEFITTVVTRYKGKIYCWDVVNEVIEGDGSFRVADSVWYRFSGEEYIEKSFTWAHEADPGAALFFNDYGVAEINSRSTAYYNLAKKLLEKGVPVHGFGMQMHLVEESAPDYKKIYDNIKRFTDLGLEVHITEMDVRIKGDVTPAKLKNQADIYGEIFKIALAFDMVTNVTTWGLVDGSSWIPGAFPGYSAPLLFDDQLNAKPAFFKIYDVLKQGPRELKFESERTKNYLTEPFKAKMAGSAPQIDGNINDGEWDSAVVYPFGYNQLESANQLVPSPGDLTGNWRILYKDNTIYGAIQRQDDITVTSLDNSWENDNVEVFFGIDEDFVQLRSLVGQGFEDHQYAGFRKGMWSDDGTVFEFSIELPPDSLGGKIIGWNIALSDNDGAGARDHQVYPVYGLNLGYQGKNFGEIEFLSPGKSSERLGAAHALLPLKASMVENAPTVDGVAESAEWELSTVYPFGFDHLNSSRPVLPPADDLYGIWRIVYNGNTLYGMVERKDNVTVTGSIDSNANDNVAIVIDRGDGAITLSTVVGEDFASKEYHAKAVWNEQGSVLEFSIDLPESPAGTILGWDIILSDCDDYGGPVHKLSPFNGTVGGDGAPKTGGIKFE